VEILSINNYDHGKIVIKGITNNDEEHKIAQFADDTRMMSKDDGISMVNN